MTTRDAITEGLDLTASIDKTKRRLDKAWLWFDDKDDTHPLWEKHTDIWIAEVKRLEGLYDQRTEIEEGLRVGD